MHLQTGYQIVDLGCGPGTDTIPLAEFIGTTGKVIGVDIDNQMIITANKNAKEAGVADRVIHKHYDAMSLPFDSDCFDACRTERLFQHVLNPEKVLTELVRITRPGGWIVAADTDHSTLSIDNSVIDIEWRLRRFRTDKFKGGYAGRQLYRLYKQQNISDIIVEIFPFFSTDYALTRYFTLLDEAEREAIVAGIITKEELQHWHTNLEKADEEGVFFSSFTMIMVAGRKNSLSPNTETQR
ncbi:MAG: methyltransferase domain-containing protein [Candidatus Methanoperedens sp.]|nr:methyltransferase domain-containing protein [Candidatus Methanoperedens sp.]MCE8424517.1 methyltransferase domain-containing protein [Candidatus Methanoperedens sp.]MCE8426941.1 methyltransferase domain-containing protein [Candidatus Methanoperedens sp.]